MKVKLKSEMPYFNNEDYRMITQRLKGAVVEVDTKFLWDSTFNCIDPETKGVFALDIDLVEEIFDDARIGKSKCGNCQHVHDTDAVNPWRCPKCHQDTSKKFVTTLPKAKVKPVYATQDDQLALTYKVASRLGDGWEVSTKKDESGGSLVNPKYNFYIDVMDLNKDNQPHADRDKWKAWAYVPHRFLRAKEEAKAVFPVTKVSKSRGIEALLAAIEKKIIPIAEEEMLKVEAISDKHKQEARTLEENKKFLLESIPSLKLSQLSGNQNNAEPYFVSGVEGIREIKFVGDKVNLNFSGNTISLYKARQIMEILAVKNDK